MADYVPPFLSCNICSNPLSVPGNVLSLSTLSKIVKTCIGPQGKLKLIRNSSSSHTSITSSSERLFHLIHVKNAVAKLIISSVKSQIQEYNNGGLQCAFFTLSLIENSSLSDIPFPLLGSLYEYFIKTVTSCLKYKDNSCVWRIDYTNLNNLKSIVQSLISTKPGCLLTRDDKEYLCSLLLKTFIKFFPESSSTSCSFNFKFLVLEGRDVRESQIFNGLLIKVSKLDWTLLSKFKYMSAKIAVFTMSLSGDCEFFAQSLVFSSTTSGAVLKCLQNIVAKLISEKVNFVFCQKVIHPSLKKQLHDAGVVVFDQLGLEITAYLQYLIGGFVNSSLLTKLTFSTVALSKEKIRDNYYILLENEHFPFCSLMVCNHNEEALLELKLVCQQILNSLIQLLKYPNVCYGAGCADIYTAIVLTRKVKSELHDISTTFGCLKSSIISALRYFIQSLVSVGISSHQKDQLDFVTETTYGHLWNLQNGNYPSKNDSCACGRFTASSSLDWHYLSDLEIVSDHFNLESMHNSNPSDKLLILDVVDCKSNSFTRAGEIATMLLKTTHCISSREVNQDCHN